MVIFFFRIISKRVPRGGDCKQRGFFNPSLTIIFSPILYTGGGDLKQYKINFLPIEEAMNQKIML